MSLGRAPCHRASGGRSRWLAGIILAAAVLVPHLDRIEALAADQDSPRPEIEISAHDGLLTLRTADAPLADVLRRIGEVAGFRVVLVGTLDTPVSWALTEVPLETVLQRLLGRRSYVITYDEPKAEGGTRRLAEVRFLREGLAEGGPDVEIGGPQTASPKIKGPTDIVLPSPDDDRDTRLRFVRSMAQNPTAAAVAGLDLLLSQDEDPLVRRIAAMGLAKADGDAAMVALTAAVEDKDTLVRKRAIQALGRKKDSRAIQALSQVLLEDPDPQVRLAAVYSLRKINSDEALKALRLGESDSDQSVRRDAALALAQMRKAGIGSEN